MKKFIIETAFGYLLDFLSRPQKSGFYRFLVSEKTRATKATIDGLYKKMINEHDKENSSEQAQS